MVFESVRTEEQRFPCIRRLARRHTSSSFYLNILPPQFGRVPVDQTLLPSNLLCYFLLWLLPLTCFNA
jgi:hypothetical protein